MTTVYLMRHSEPLKITNEKNSDSLQLQNEKLPLTRNGEKLAKKKSKRFKQLDCIYSSNYVRAISTAKYFAKDKVYIVEDFAERKFGIEKWDELPNNFEKLQWDDFDYKLKNGESLNDVIKREYDGLLRILDKHKNKKILIVGHATAFAALFTKLCNIKNIEKYTFNDKVFFDGKWDFCETFKLVFDDTYNLISIENI